MRPASIVQFERLYLAAAAVWLLSTLLGWTGMMAAIRSQPGGDTIGTGGAIVLMAVIYAVILGQWFLVRHGKVIGKWVISAGFVYSMVSLALAIFRSGFHVSLVSLTSWVGFALLAWSVSYLFKPDAEAWFAAARV